MPEWRNSTNSFLENSKNDLKTIQKGPRENKKKKKLKSLYRVGKITKDKNRPIRSSLMM